MGEAYSDALADHQLTLETVAVIPYCEPDSGTAIKVRRKTGPSTACRALRYP